MCVLIFSTIFFLKKSLSKKNIRIHENLLSGSQVVQYGPTDGQTDRYDKPNSGFVQFCKCV